MATVPITTIANLELHTGQPVADVARANYFINAISAYIAAYCDLISLEEIVDDEVRLQADYYGIIELGGGPISAVTSVTAVGSTGDSTGWSFDGMGRIHGLGPFQTVDIVYTHGSDEIPADLVLVATEAVIQATSIQVAGGLVRRTVGDVTYAFAEGNNVGLQLSEGVLDRYRTNAYTLRLGPHSAGDGNYRPVNWFQIGG